MSVFKCMIENYAGTCLTLYIIHCIRTQIANCFIAAGVIPILRVLKQLRNEGTSSALQTAGPSRGSDHHVEMAVPSPVGGVKIVSPISPFVLNTLTLKKKCVFFVQLRPTLTLLLTLFILHCS